MLLHPSIIKDIKRRADRSAKMVFLTKAALLATGATFFELSAAYSRFL
ncbi:hypothetical protein ambt_06070 [Alteromonas naphthalenivorans]|jgi:hypothetical protein|uniref:Uncharacterized protein n=1 Tax=Alteromonas naphthalenivorans TaxID=715451 RepID=F5ZCK2_ALTNA|nr:hypothetical protein ambt_06070 [Alteromonas naphthalenivorans]